MGEYDTIEKLKSMIVEELSARPAFRGQTVHVTAFIANADDPEERTEVATFASLTAAMELHEVALCCLSDLSRLFLVPSLFTSRGIRLPAVLFL